MLVMLVGNFLTAKLLLLFALMLDCKELRLNRYVKFLIAMLGATERGLLVPIGIQNIKAITKI
ncbi:hypothetical protein B7486_52410 [cyanobacterium TDX16]|nr:hypothetical protein B7486_52410 [cyanobacterium TDX16]